MIQSAYFANPENSAIVAISVEMGAVLLSPDSPWWGTAAEIATPYTPPPHPPDWVGFRRDLLASEVYTAIKLANFTPTTYHLPGELSAALVVDPPNCPIVCGLWNQLERPLTAGQIEWLRTAIAAHHIPLTLADNGDLTYAPI